jgi:hypothetical protein
VADNDPTPWRRRAARAAVEASTGAAYWSVDPVDGPLSSLDLVAPPVLVGAVPVRSMALTHLQGGQRAGRS